MNSDQVTLALRREKELLEQVLEMAQCQLELIETGRIKDLEILLTLRESAMSEMELIESLNPGWKDLYADIVGNSSLSSE